VTILISPAGERVEVTNITAFAKKHGLDRANLQHVATGERQHHKGWRSADGTVGFVNKPWAIERYLK